MSMCVPVHATHPIAIRALLPRASHRHRHILSSTTISHPHKRILHGPSASRSHPHTHSTSPPPLRISDFSRSSAIARAVGRPLPHTPERRPFEKALRCHAVPCGLLQLHHRSMRAIPVRMTRWILRDCPASVSVSIGSMLSGGTWPPHLTTAPSDSQPVRVGTGVASTVASIAFSSRYGGNFLGHPTWSPS